MFDFLKSGGTPGSGPPDNKDMPVETRLLLAFILMGAVLFTTPYFFKTPPEPPPVKKTDTVAAGKIPPPAPSTAPASPAAAAASPAPGQIAAGNEETVTLDTDLYHVVLSN